jgi:hypothetical protein
LTDIYSTLTTRRGHIKKRQLDQTERRGDPARLQASESILGRLMSGEAWRSGKAAGE